jgi:hypothetical protein
VRWDGTLGQFIQNSTAILDDAGNLSVNNLVDASLDPNAIVATDAGSQLVSVANTVAGEVLTSNGPGVTPTFQPAAGGGGTITSVIGTVNQIDYTPAPDVVLSFSNTAIFPGTLSAGEYTINGNQITSVGTFRIRSAVGFSISLAPGTPLAGVGIGGNLSMANGYSFIMYNVGNTRFTAFRATAQLADVVYTMPPGPPAADGYTISSTTAGVWTWVPPGGPGRIVSFQTITASGTYVKPVGITSILVEMVGGGGGGGNATAAPGGSSAGGGGGAGGYVRHFIAAAAANYAVVIGAGGGSAGNGTATTFGGILTAGGGLAGQSNGNSNQVTVVQGGAGGVGAGGNITNQPGSPGGLAVSSFAGAIACGGNGGASHLGGGAQGTTVNPANGDAALANSGGGGAGGHNYNNAGSRFGGSGGSGVIIVWEAS